MKTNENILSLANKIGHFEVVRRMADDYSGTVVVICTCLKAALSADNDDSRLEQLNQVTKAVETRNNIYNEYISFLNSRGDSNCEYVSFLETSFNEIVNSKCSAVIASMSGFLSNFVEYRSLLIDYLENRNNDPITVIVNEKDSILTKLSILDALDVTIPLLSDMFGVYEDELDRGNIVYIKKPVVESDIASNISADTITMIQTNKKVSSAPNTKKATSQSKTSTSAKKSRKKK